MNTNDFTLNSTAITDTKNENYIVFSVHHKWFYDEYDTVTPFTSGNSPDGDTDYELLAKMYCGNTTTDKRPFLTLYGSSFPVSGTKIYPTVCENFTMAVGSGNAWNGMIPDSSTSAAAVFERDIPSINTTYGWVGAQDGAQAVIPIISFDVSSYSASTNITSIKLSIYGGYQVSQVIDDGIVVLKTTLADPTDPVQSDYGRIDLSGAGPTLYSSTVITNWITGYNRGKVSGIESINVSTYNSINTGNISEINGV
tara:strand:+ start:1582 stop:2343 length:762 start_codon:yes stop_codon:yes gene_type:complete